MYYVMPLEETENPRFDAYVEGVLFDSREEIAINIFILGESVVKRASKYYVIKADLDLSEMGKIRDRLVTLVHNSPILIVSSKFKNFLNINYSGHADFFPVEFDSVNDKPLKDYFICSLTQKYDCIDYENSVLDFEFYTDENVGYGDIYTIDSLTIDETKIPESVHIFMLENTKSPVVILSETLKQEMEKQQITGFKLVHPIDFMI
jgi:hypothetical protein